MSLSTWRSVRRSAAITTVVAAGLLGTGFVGVANAANTNISGSVKTSGGAAVAGVTVAVKVGTQTKNATTAANGTFSISGVQTGAATITLGSAAAPAAGLPQVWQVKNISTSIAANAVLNFSLPATTTVTANVGLSGTPVQGAAITQCSADSDAANPAVVLAGAAAVAPTQEFTGALTDAAGQAALSVFADTTFGRLCGTFSQTVGGQVNDYLARSGIKDSTVTPSMTLFVPSTVAQAGTVKDSTATGQSNLKVAIRSAGGQVDSASAPTTAGGAFSCLVAAGNVFARISGRSLSNTVAPPTNIPRSFKATIDGSADGTTPWNVNLPATVTLTVKVQNADGTPVKNAIVRPLTTGGFDAANSAGIVAGQPNAQISQQIYGDNLSGANGEVYVRLFGDSNLGGFKVIKNLAGTSSREATVAAGTVVVSNTTITVTLPA
ncbi:MAG: carboxypeptidase regulatory-like domain-containing protein [Actinomycetes bacterium]